MNSMERNRWLEADGTQVTLHGHVHVLRVAVYEAIYPYRHTVCRVHAEPYDKTTPWYQATKRQLGDDWSTDVLASEEHVTVDIMHQLGW